MKLITETIDAQVKEELNEATGEKNLFIEGIFLQGNVKNRNGRIYPMEVMESAVQKYKSDYIDSGRAFGELGHPKGPQINLDRVSHIITELKRDGDNYLGRAKITTNTPMGSIAAGILKDGGKLGVSSRGLGTLKESNGANVVQKDFFLATAADIVADPSAPSAFVNGIYESTEWVWDGDSLREQAVEAVKEQFEKDTKTMSEAEASIKAFQSFMQKITKI